VVDDKAAEPVPADGMTPACRHVVLRAVARVSPLSALARTSSVHRSWTARGRAHGPLARPLHFARVHEKPKPSAAARIAGGWKRFVMGVGRRRSRRRHTVDSVLYELDAADMWAGV